MVEDQAVQVQPVSSNTELPKTILIVDDDESQLVALEFRLENLGFRTLTASSGAVALQTAFAKRPSLVLLDLRLPDMDGQEVCSRLADAPQTCGTPVIVVSAMERPDIVRLSRRAGCDFYLRKPYDPNVLLTLIERALQEAPELNW